MTVQVDRPQRAQSANPRTANCTKFTDPSAPLRIDRRSPSSVSCECARCRHIGIPLVHRQRQRLGERRNQVSPRFPGTDFGNTDLRGSPPLSCRVALARLGHRSYSAPPTSFLFDPEIRDSLRLLNVATACSLPSDTCTEVEHLVTSQQ